MAVYKVPHIQTVITCKLLGELRGNLTIMARHIPPGPAIHLKVMPIIIFHPNLLKDVFLIYGIDLTALCVALKQLLRHVLAAC